MKKPWLLVSTSETETGIAQFRTEQDAFDQMCKEFCEAQTMHCEDAHIDRTGAWVGDGNNHDNYSWAIFELDASEEDAELAQIPEPQTNTVLYYLYRDGANYKIQNSVVLSGSFTDAEISVMESKLNEGVYFIPYDVGLPEKRFDKWDYEVDHCWFELLDGDGDTIANHTEETTAPHCGISCHELAARFARVGDWDDTIKPWERPEPKAWKWN